MHKNSISYIYIYIYILYNFLYIYIYKVPQKKKKILNNIQCFFSDGPLTNLKYIDGIPAWPNSNITATSQSIVECSSLQGGTIAVNVCDEATGYLFCKKSESPIQISDYLSTD